MDSSGLAADSSDCLVSNPSRYGLCFSVDEIFITSALEMQTFGEYTR
ncbi:hypothetical protein RBSH_03312 [Rhodopirellula baltica SH28]|uniref:Uncharacterized protein n=1 Tax=Rhodopirellula baltica SH28 TaxID=993517 RepID=K5DG29_RHOBT|nr:hypothetical protein RBSH_03312 [Rhodopirellula baltica SH28]